MTTRPVTVTYSDGREEIYDTLADAVAALEAEYEDAEIGHDGDLEDGGDRTLVWATEDASRDDDGARAVASIRWAD